MLAAGWAQTQGMRAPPPGAVLLVPTQIPAAGGVREALGCCGMRTRPMGQAADVSPPSRWKKNTFLRWRHWRRALLQLLGSLNSSSQLPRGAWLPVIPAVPRRQGGAAGAGAASTACAVGQTGMAVVFIWELPVPARGWLSLAVPLRGGRVVATRQAVLPAAPSRCSSSVCSSATPHPPAARPSCPQGWAARPHPNLPLQDVLNSKNATIQDLQLQLARVCKVRVGRNPGGV